MITGIKSGTVVYNPFAPGEVAPRERALETLPARTFQLDTRSTDEVLAEIHDGKIAALLPLANAEFDPKLIASIDPSRISVGTAGGVLLSKEAAALLVERKIGALERALFGVESTSAAFAGRAKDVQLDTYRAYLAARERGELARSDELVEYHRLLDRSPDAFAAVLDPNTGSIGLTEKIAPISIATESGASAGIAMAGVTEAQERFLRESLEQIFPESALSILARSGTKLSFASEIGEVSPTAIAMFGEGCAIADLACPDLGRYWPFLSEAMIPLVPETTLTTEALLSIVVHELAHALDWALGAPGQRLSDSEQWQQLFANAEIFPTERSRQDAGEFFAECAAIYLLGRHVDVQPLRDQIALRSDLDPAVYAALEKLFGEELAERDRAGVRLSDDTKRLEIERAIANAEQKERSFASLYHVAAWSHILAVVTGSRDARTRALDAVRQAAQLEQGTNFARELAAEIERR